MYEYIDKRQRKPEGQSKRHWTQNKDEQNKYMYESRQSKRHWKQNKDEQNKYTTPEN